MHDVRESFHAHQIRHTHGPVVTDPAQVIPPQVHQHHVLRALLLVGQQLRFQPAIILVRIPARPRAGERPGFHDTAFQAHQQLRRGSDDFRVFEVQEEHVRRGVYRAQRTVNVQRVHILDHG